MLQAPVVAEDADDQNAWTSCSWMMPNLMTNGDWSVMSSEIAALPPEQGAATKQDGPERTPTLPANSLPANPQQNLLPFLLMFLSQT